MECCRWSAGHISGQAEATYLTVMSLSSASPSPMIYNMADLLTFDWAGLTYRLPSLYYQ